MVNSANSIKDEVIEQYHIMRERDDTGIERYYVTDRNIDEHKLVGF